ncbi:MAG: sugar phosphate nucleotidyltransferase [Muribaculum sp.]|nr:sugar phosphate nucleotidyltransferase [Muribaculum sp.]
MKIILLSGGSGTRLWPLSNDARSKQFLRLLDVEGCEDRESMVQRVMRQLREAGIDADITIATSASQHDSVISQLGTDVDIVTEPSRRDTFPAICLACEYLALEKGCPEDETVIVMPCDPYTEQGYFEAVKKMAAGIDAGAAELIVMGIVPTYPSAKYGYVVPSSDNPDKEVIPVSRFTEKPDVATAEKLISEGAQWNGGVFAFRLGYLTEISRGYVKGDTFTDIYDKYEKFPKISFDYEVAEKAKNVGMVEYRGEWKDLGTWNTLTDELKTHTYGKVITDGTCENTHLFNELNIPMLCLGTKDLVVAASPDGILVTEKGKSENIKTYAASLKQRPMYEERRWGYYRVIDTVEYPDGHKSLTKRLTVNPDQSISYQRHSHRDEVWTIVDGDGELIINGERRPIGRGETVKISKGTLHALKAHHRLTLIEVQTGKLLEEADIERFPYEW